MTDEEEVARLDRMLTRLIANYEAATADYTRFSRRPMAPYMEVARGAPGMTDARWSQLEEAYDADSGLLAASDASDAAHIRMVDFTRQLLGRPSLSRDVLRLKARACLFEAPLDRLHEEGFGQVATLMAQLAAPDTDDPGLQL
jgi:hypothetical protein